MRGSQALDVVLETELATLELSNFPITRRRVGQDAVELTLEISMLSFERSYVCPEHAAGYREPSTIQSYGKALRPKANLAERVGFEPTIPLQVCRISSAVHSTTLPPLRIGSTLFSAGGT